MKKQSKNTKQSEVPLTINSGFKKKCRVLFKKNKSLPKHFFFFLHILNTKMYPAT